MISYNWDRHDLAKRINTHLQTDGYKTWIDLEKMEGSFPDSMSGEVSFIYNTVQAYVVCDTMTLNWTDKPFINANVLVC